MFSYTSIYFLITGKQIKVILNLVTHWIAHGFLCKFYSTQVSVQFYFHSSQNIIPCENIPTWEALSPFQKKKYSESLSSLTHPHHPQCNFWPYASTHIHHVPVKTLTYPVGTDYVHTQIQTGRRNLGWKNNHPFDLWDKNQNEIFRQQHKVKVPSEQDTGIFWMVIT